MISKIKMFFKNLFGIKKPEEKKEKEGILYPPMNDKELEKFLKDPESFRKPFEGLHFSVSAVCTHEEREKLFSKNKKEVVFSKEETAKIFEKINSEISAGQMKLDHESFIDENKAKEIIINS